MIKKAFTLIELIFVIVLVGILSGVAIMSFSPPSELRLATDQVIRHINYTKHLAMIDDKYTPVPEGTTTEDIKNSRMWYKQKWSIYFGSRNSGQTWFYSIFSDSPSGTADDEFNGVVNKKSEVAVDPHSRNYMSFHSSVDPDGDENINLTVTYNIIDIDLSQGCNEKSVVMFDYLGRPYNGFNTGATATTNNPYADMYQISTTCIVTLQHSSEGNATICIEPVTGYVRDCS